MKINISHFPILLILLLTVLAAGCSNEIQPGETKKKPGSVIKASLLTVKTENQKDRYEAVGTIEAKTAATIAAKVMGEITKIAVKEGDQVKKGDLLISIEDRQILAQFNQAKAGLAEAQQAANAAQSAFKSAEASARLAELTYNRYKSLLESNSVSRQEFDEVEAKHHQSAAGLTQAAAMRDAAAERVKQATAAVSSAEFAWQDTSIITPYDAIITAKLVQIGDLAAPGTPLLKLEEVGALEVRVYVPETSITDLKVGDPVSIEIPSAAKTVEGTISTIDPAADSSSRSFLVKIALPETTGLHTGLFARAFIPVKASGMVLIPKTAVIIQGQLTGIFMLDQKNIAHFRLIRTGREFNDQIEVVSGLKDGDRLVSNPDHTISDGVKVESK